MPPLDDPGYDPLAGAGPATAPLIPTYDSRGQWIGYERGPTPVAGTPSGTQTPSVTVTAKAPSAEEYDPLAGVTPPAAVATRGTAPAQSASPISGVGAPAGAAQPAPQQELRNQPWYQGIWDAVHSANAAFGGATSEMAHNYTMGLDEILAPLVPAITSSLVEGKPFTQAYSEQVSRMREPRHAFEEAAPGTSTAIAVTGGLASSPLFNPLFAAGSAPSVTQAVANAMRNIGASGAIGGASGALMTEGGVSERARGAGEGAAVGTILGAVPPLASAAFRAVGNPIKAVAPIINPDAAGQRMAGSVLNEAVGGSLPAMQTAPTPGVPLNVAQASGSPELASLVDTRNAANVPAMQRERTAQNQAALRVIPHTSTGEEPEEAAAAASGRATAATQRAAHIINTEERRVWNKPSLTKPNVSTWTAKDLVQGEVASLRRDQPGLALAIEESAVLRRTIAELNLMPPKAAANQINAISSRFRAIARNPNNDGDVRLVATRLANATQEGIWQAPEVAGRPPATQDELDTRIRQAVATAPPGTVPPLTRAARPESLLTFLIRRGGLKPHGDLSAMNAELYHHRAGGRLVTKGGLSLDYGREAAVEAGFLPQNADINDFLTAINDELAGRRIYRPEDMTEAVAWEAADREVNRSQAAREVASEHVGAAALDMGANLSPAEAQHAVQMLVDNPEMHPEEAVRQAVYAGEESLLQQNADRLAFGPPGLPPSAMNHQLPDMQTLREGVAADPELARDLKAARDFTRREAEVLGHASFDNILRRNSRGNDTVTPGSALNRFFDFSTGSERPGAIANVTRFLDDIRSEWLKLGQAERTGSFNPDTINPVKQDLTQNLRDFLMAKFLGRVSSGTERDMQGDRMIQFGQASKWLSTNKDMLQRSGVFTAAQLDDLDNLRRTGELIQRGYDLGRPRGSATYSRLMGNNTFMDLFMTPFASRALGIGFGGLLGTLTGQGAFGILFGAESGFLGAEVLRMLYEAPRARAIEWLDRGIRDPQIAADLAKKATPRNAPKLSNATKAWLRSIAAAVPAEQGGRLVGAPQPEPVQ